MMASDQYDPEYNESMWEAEFIGTRDDGKYTEGRMGNEIGNMQNANCGKGYGAAFMPVHSFFGICTRKSW